MVPLSISGSGERDPNFLLLPSEVLSKVVSFLDNAELFKLRQVSKQLKVYSDYELKSRKSELVVNQNNQHRFEGLVEVFCDIRALKFNCTTLPFEKLIKLCSGKLTKLTAFSVFASFCGIENIHLIADVFPNIQNLSLTWIEASDHILSNLFSRLPQLQSIRIEAVPVTGSCFAKLGKDVEQIVFDGETAEININSLFSCDRSALKVLNLLADNVTDSETFLELLSKTAPNLESLGLKLRSALLNYDRLFLPKLRLLTFVVNGIEGDFERLKPMICVEQAYLDIVDINDINLGKLITNFPKIDWLSLDLSHNSDIKLSQSFIHQMRSLHHLYYFAFHDENYKESKYDWSGFQQNAFLDIVRTLPNICEVDVHLRSAKNDESFDELLDAAKLIVTSRPNIWFEMFVNGKEVCLN